MPPVMEPPRSPTTTICAVRHADLRARGHREVHHRERGRRHGQGKQRDVLGEPRRRGQRHHLEGPGSRHDRQRRQALAGLSAAGPRASEARTASARAVSSPRGIPRPQPARRWPMADDTLARMFWARVERSGPEPAQQSKQGGAWRTLSWNELGVAVREVALGLLALGRQEDDPVGVVSSGRAEWVQADFAIFSAGCRTIPVYPSYPPDLVRYIVNDAEIRTLIVEDTAQLAKVIEARRDMPGLEQAVVIQGYEGKEPWVLTWEALRRVGRDS